MINDYDVILLSGQTYLNFTGTIPRIVQTLHELWRLESEDMIIKLYMELLNRKPDPIELEQCMSQLSLEHGKKNTVAGMLKSDEAAQLYRQPLHPLADYPPTIANIFRSLFHANDVQFIQGLYRELLCREPDFTGLLYHFSFLHFGKDRIMLVHEIFLSDECRELISSEEPPQVYDPHKALQKKKERL